MNFIERVIDRLHSCSFRYFNEGYGSDLVIRLDDAVSIVKESLMTRWCDKNDIWTKCNVSLPPNTGHFLVTVPRHAVPQYAWYLHTEHKWYYYNSTTEMKDVIAWTDLPDIYRELTYTDSQVTLYECKSKEGDYTPYQGGWK